MTTVPATPVSTECATMALTSTNVCAPQDIQVCFARYPSKVTLITVQNVSEMGQEKITI